MSVQTKQLPVFSRFVAVGLTATLLYAALALLFGGLFANMASQALLSLLAYAIAAVYSYSAHRLFTFMSNGAHKVQIPRFVMLSLTGAAISFVIPVIIENWLKLSIFISVATVCVIVPVFNFVVLDRWVFRDRDDVSG